MRICEFCNNGGFCVPLDPFLVYYDIDSTANCGNSLNATSGWIGVHHLQTSIYDGIFDCVWSITGKETHRVVLAVLNSYIEWSEGCEDNYLMVSTFLQTIFPCASHFTYLQLVVIFERL